MGGAAGDSGTPAATITALEHGSVGRSLAATGGPAVLAIVSDALDRLAEAGYVAATVALTGVMALGVFFRYVLNRSLSWSDELALVLFVWATFLSISMAYRHDRHVSIDLVVRRLGSAWGQRVASLAEGLAGGYLAALLVSSVQALELAGRSRTDALQWPLTVPYAAIPVSAAVMLVHWACRNLRAPWPAVALPVVVGFAFFVLVYLPVGQYVQVTGPARFVVRRRSPRPS